MRRTIYGTLILALLLTPLWAWLAWWNLPNDIREGIFDLFWFEKHDLLLGKERPAMTFLPKGYEDNPDKSYPLLITLHGYQSFPSENEIYFDLVEQANQKGFVLVMPEGKLKPNKVARFWNATEDCCAEGIQVDDVGFIKSLAIEAKEKLRINPDQVFLFGYSNGGYMSYRVSCEDEGLFTGVVVLAGLSFKDESKCIAPTPRTVIHLHGTSDQIVPIDASSRKAAPLDEVLKRWQDRNSCGEAKVSLNQFDMGHLEDGSETDLISYQNCQLGYSLNYFRMNNLSHIPYFKTNILDVAWPILMKDSQERLTVGSSN